MNRLFEYWDAAGHGSVPVEQLFQAVKTVHDREGGAWPQEVRDEYALLQQLLLPLLSDAAGDLGIDMPGLAVVKRACAEFNAALPDLLDREHFITILTRVTDKLPGVSFDAFITHCYETVEFVASLAASSRAVRATYAVFQEWGTARAGALDLDDVAQVLRTLPPGLAGAALAADGSLDPELLSAEAQASGELSLADFQRIVRTMGDGSEAQTAEVLRGITAKIKSGKSYHLVSKYLEEDKLKRRAERRTPRKPAAGDVSSPGSTADGIVQQLGTPKHMAQEKKCRLRQEMRHSLDALTLRHVEQHFDVLEPPEYYNVVAAVVCLMLDIPQGINPCTLRNDYWEGLKGRLSDDFVGFLHKLYAFDPCDKGECPLEKVRRAVAYYFRAEFDPNSLLRHSWFFSSLCQWCRAALQLACVHNGWAWPPPPLDPTPPAERDGAGAAPGRRPPPPAGPARRAARALRADLPPSSPDSGGFPVTGSAGFLVLYRSPRKDRALKDRGSTGGTPRRIATLHQNAAVLDPVAWLSPRSQRQQHHDAAGTAGPAGPLMAAGGGRGLGAQHVAYLHQMDQLNKELALGPGCYDGVA